MSQFCQILCFLKQHRSDHYVRVNLAAKCVEVAAQAGPDVFSSFPLIQLRSMGDARRFLNQ